MTYIECTAGGQPARARVDRYVPPLDGFIRGMPSDGEGPYIEFTLIDEQGQEDPDLKDQMLPDERAQLTTNILDEFEGEV